MHKNASVLPRCAMILLIMATKNQCSTEVLNPITMMQNERNTGEDLYTDSNKIKRKEESHNLSLEKFSVYEPTISKDDSEAKFTQEVLKPVAKKTIDDFVILEEMGEGAYGQVKLVRYKKDSNRKMVIKYVTKRRILIDTWTRDRRLGTVPLEIHVLDFLRQGGLQHPNIIEMADFFEDEVNYYIETVPHGLPGMDLFDYIELRTNMGEDECRNIFVQVAQAICHLHTKASIVHRDIKDENIVLDREGKIKLIDFGSAAYIKNGPFDVFVGTIDFAAPEILSGKPYRGKEQDVWALGILLYTIVYREKPFSTPDEIKESNLRIPYVMNEDNLSLIRAMLDQNVETRATIEEVLRHPWCKTIEKKT
ncbi:Serine/threonine-protein kinase ppk6 [Erysiphe neolycopersici]|uniref:non-specific serine/threonine protein kinase n=1 Tax=Erysiphe neolycopersici TaxID=212602 RepID=A0A420HWB5_9PEZI|nr:Serine/threonine-protein kinase ppk6 [Erysiphe neolycopersici]